MRESWLGGFVRVTDDGEEIYVIRKRVAGTRYEVSTRCNTERAALKQLERFEADPAGYVPGSDEKEKREPIFLNLELANAFLDHSRDVKKNSASWRYQQKLYIAWWSSKLKGVDLGRASLRDDIEPALEGVTARQHRIATIKAFYAWLRKVKRVITLAEDPTFATLMVPQARPGARAMRDKSIPKEDYLKARAHLNEHWRAGMDVQAGTAWHLTEVSRFALGGSIEPHPMKAKGVAGVLVCPEAKGGGELRTPVGEEVRAAAEVLLKRGIFGIQRYTQAVKVACEAAGVKPFTPGRFRHSVSTWAINMGTDPAQVSAFLNHKDGRTTRKFYATHAVVT